MHACISHDSHRVTFQVERRSLLCSLYEIPGLKWEQRREEVEDEEEKEEEEAALCFLPLCIMDEERRRCSISGSLTAEGRLPGLPSKMLSCREGGAAAAVNSHLNRPPHSNTVSLFTTILHC